MPYLRNANPRTLAYTPRPQVIGMRFVLGSGNLLRGKLSGLPTYYFNVFSHSQILVIGMLSERVIAVCGIAGISNFISEYVEEEYRGQGIGRLLFAKTVNAAREQGLDFVAASMSTRNIQSLHLVSGLRFREIVRLKESGWLITVLPFTFKGKLVFHFFHITWSVLPETFLVRGINLLRHGFQFGRKKGL